MNYEKNKESITKSLDDDTNYSIRNIPPIKYISNTYLLS